MGINWDPSHDWDRHCDEQERAMMEEVNFYAQHKAEITTIAAALLTSGTYPNTPLDQADISGLIDEAASIVRCIVSRGQDPYE